MSRPSCWPERSPCRTCKTVSRRSGGDLVFRLGVGHDRLIASDGVEPLAMAFDERPRLDHEVAVDDVSRHLRRPDLAANSAVDADRLRFHLADDRGVLAHRQRAADNVALNHAVDLYVAVADEVADDLQIRADDGGDLRLALGFWLRHVGVL